MSWTVKIANKRTEKQIKQLPKPIQKTLAFLISDLETNGPRTSGGWKNYGKLEGMKGDKRHCHISKGRPTYVCCWEVIDKQIKIMEVYYASTHENAPY